MMVTIKKLSASIDGYESLIEAVAALETSVQLQEGWSYQTLSDLLKQDSINLLIASNNQKSDSKDEIMGYCLYQVVFEQAEILRIGTRPDYQRQGLALQLFAELNKELKDNKIESLLLEVRADNLPALALYEQQGFKVIHKRKAYYKRLYQPSIDALIMQKSYIQS